MTLAHSHRTLSCLILVAPIIVLVVVHLLNENVQKDCFLADNQASSDIPVSFGVSWTSCQVELLLLQSIVFHEPRHPHLWLHHAMAISVGETPYFSAILQYSATAALAGELLYLAMYPAAAVRDIHSNWTALSCVIKHEHQSYLKHMYTLGIWIYLGKC
jgi:hypothetical protein